MVLAPPSGASAPSDLVGLVDRVEAHARSTAALTCEAVEVGGFVAYFPRDLAGAGLAHAVPRADAKDADALAADLAELRRLFVARDRAPRVELSLLRWPGLGRALEVSGFVPDEETMLLVCARDAFLARESGAQVSWIGDDDDLRFACAVMRQGFELRGPPPSDDEIDGLRLTLHAGVRLAIARIDGAPAGSGCSRPDGAVTEISAVSTLPTRRRRGVASDVISFLCAQHFGHGGEVAWGCVPDPAVAALCLGLGWQDAGLRVAYRGA